MLAGLKHFRHRRHEVILFHVLDPAELDFPFRQMTLFKGLEELPDVLADPRALRQAYLQRVRSVFASGQARLPRAADRLCATAHRPVAGNRAVELSGLADEPNQVREHEADEENGHKKHEKTQKFLSGRVSRDLAAPLVRPAAAIVARRRSASLPQDLVFAYRLSLVRPVAMMYPPLAFGFGNLLMFWWLAAAGLPIVIHLWNKRKYREVPWAAIEYLLAALRKNSRRIRLEQWMLLAMRTLIIALVVLAMAEPFLEQRRPRASLPGQRTHKLLVIDGSYSMAYKPTDKTRFERAKQLADADRRGEPAGRRLHAGPDGHPAERHRRFAGHGAARFSGGDRQSEAAARRRRSAGHAGQSRRSARRRPSTRAWRGAKFIFSPTWAATLGCPSWERRGRGRISRSAGAAGRAGHAGRARPGPAGDARTWPSPSLRTADPFTVVGREVTLDRRGAAISARWPRAHQSGRVLRRRPSPQGSLRRPRPPASKRRCRSAIASRRPATTSSKLGWAPTCSTSTTIAGCRCRSRNILRVLCVDGKPAGGGLGGATDYLVLALDPDAGRSEQAASWSSRRSFPKARCSSAT